MEVTLLFYVLRIYIIGIMEISQDRSKGTKIINKTITTNMFETDRK